VTHSLPLHIEQDDDYGSDDEASGKHYIDKERFMHICEAMGLYTNDDEF
jgi:hypothetical protein